MKVKLFSTRNHMLIALLLCLFSGSTLAENSSKKTLLLPAKTEINKASCCHFRARHHRMIVDVIKTGSDERYNAVVFFRQKKFNEITEGKKLTPGEWGEIKLYDLTTGKYEKKPIPVDSRFIATDYWAYPEEDIGGSGFSWSLKFNKPGQYLISVELNAARLEMNDMVFSFHRKRWSK